MPSSWEQIVVDAEDPARLARWWAEALGYQIVHEEPDEIEIRRTPDELPGLLFTPVPEPKTVKNRLHIDLRPDDQEAEVERLVDMGARPVDIGQHDVSRPSCRVSGRGAVVLAALTTACKSGPLAAAASRSACCTVRASIVFSVSRTRTGTAIGGGEAARSAS